MNDCTYCGNVRHKDSDNCKSCDSICPLCGTEKKIDVAQCDACQIEQYQNQL